MRKCPSGCGEDAVEELCFLDEGDNCIVCGYSFPYVPSPSKAQFFELHKEWRMRRCPGDRKAFLASIGHTEETAWTQTRPA